MISHAKKKPYLSEDWNSLCWLNLFTLFKKVKKKKKYQNDVDYQTIQKYLIVIRKL